ncbi:MAG: hypothetical protein KIT84_14215 [Labilithrix sp.]|nr:hypothetical protein [Labilithrix sp.]MCW5812176.1 hypothetical protein [Labilithrix sp.]
MRSVVLALVLAGCSAAGGRSEEPVGTTQVTAALVVAKAAKAAPRVAVAAPAVEAPQPEPAVAEPVAFDAPFTGFGAAGCSYLAPTSEFIGADGAIDVVWHFHAGQMAAADMKTSGLRAVFVSCGYGIGSGGYSSRFEDPNRFGAMMKSLTRMIAARTKRSDVHLGHLALASWSAGFAAVGRILSVPQWYEATDAVLLFDSLHAQYIDLPEDAKLKNKPVAARGADHVDVKMLRRFIRFATDAAAGKKTMVVTHSSIVPPDYASTSEATAALMREVGVATRETSAPFGLPNMTPSVTADEAGLHVRGFRGQGPHDHFDHLHLIGDAVKTWLVPRWSGAYTPARERH